MENEVNTFEIKGKTPLQYAELFIDRWMKKMPAPEMSFLQIGRLGGFTYPQAIVLRGFQEIEKIDGKTEYKKYITDWLESTLNEEGIPYTDKKGWLSRESLDFRQPGNLLFDLYKETQSKKYLNCLDYLYEEMKNFKRSKHGGFYHSIAGTHEEQVWLDGLFMAGPACVKYAVLRDDKELLDIAMEQPVVMWENMRDKDTGLLRHAWDESRNAKWADKETGLSGYVWSRAMGWYAAGITEMYEAAPKEHKNAPKLAQIIKELFTVLIKYQDENGRWYQLVDKGNDSRNWLDNSGSLLILYAMAKAIRNGVIGEEFIENLRRGYTDVIVNSVFITNDAFHIVDICQATSVGEDAEYYYYRHKIVNDWHGSGGFLMLCAEIENMLRNN